ncbi:MAG: hypothetical protein HY711_04235 [Candidatus Melainabacteria bacterium]|nr:hypothetical protein [Candidatus Melainabacteria bacterium]
MAVSDVFWLLVVFSFLQPLIRQKMLEFAREQVLKRFETIRHSRVIALVHRQESMSLLGIPFFRYIDMHDAESLLRAIRFTPAHMPIDLILHTPSGLGLPVEQIALALTRHPGKVTVFIPHYAMSGGALIALAANELVMAENAVMGALDAQVGGYPARSILAVLEAKPVEKIDDKTLLLAEEASKSIRQLSTTAATILSHRMPLDKAKNIAEQLASGSWTPDYPMSIDQLEEIGLPVSRDIPVEIYQLMSLYAQSEHGRPSVDFVPMRYGKPGTPAHGARETHRH